MAWQGLKLNLKVAQKQILTPGLVQMVSVLALNRLELREMINQEMVANPVLEELGEEPTPADNYSDENFLKNETEKVPETEPANPFDEFDVGSFFNQYLDTGGDGGQSQEREISERPSFEKFLSSPAGLTDHLAWQLSVTICSDKVRELAENIIGNLDENGYLTASMEELAQEGKYSQDDLDDALAVVQDFDPIGVGARDLRECLLLQLHALGDEGSLASARADFEVVASPTTLTFDAAWNETASSAIYEGGKVVVDYDAARLPNCRASHNAPHAKVAGRRSCGGWMG